MKNMKNFLLFVFFCITMFLELQASGSIKKTNSFNAQLQQLNYGTMACPDVVLQPVEKKLQRSINMYKQGQCRSEPNLAASRELVKQDNTPVYLSAASQSTRESPVMEKVFSEDRVALRKIKSLDGLDRLFYSTVISQDQTLNSHEIKEVSREPIARDNVAKSLLYNFKKTTIIPTRSSRVYLPALNTSQSLPCFKQNRSENLIKKAHSSEELQACLYKEAVLNPSLLVKSDEIRPHRYQSLKRTEIRKSPSEPVLEENAFEVTSNLLYTPRSDGYISLSDLYEMNEQASPQPARQDCWRACLRFVFPCFA